MPNENDINLLELVKKIPLGLPMPKESVIIGNKTIVFRKGKNEINVRYKYWTPNGYLFKTLFRRWLKENKISEQEWYDKYYLNISSHTQRPKCSYSKCNNEAVFKNLIKGYLNNCGSKSCIEFIKYEGIHGDEYRRNLSVSHIGNPRLIESLRESNKRPEVRLNRSNAAKRWTNTDEGKAQMSRNSRKFWDNDENKKVRGECRRLKFINDKDFRDKMFSKLPNNFKKIKSGYIKVSNKCSNSVLGYVEYDSSYEIAFIISLESDSNVLSYIREPRDLDISYSLKGETHWYWPDILFSPMRHTAPSGRWPKFLHPVF